MRVAFINHAGAAFGGAEQSMVLFLSELADDIEATVILFEDGIFANRLRELGIKTEILSVAKDLMATTRERVGLRIVRSMPLAALKLSRALRRGRYDVVVTNSIKAHFIGSIAAKLARIPCVVHMHDILYGNPRRALSTFARLLSVERIGCSYAVAAALGAPPVTVINEPLDTRAYDALLDKTEARRRLGIPNDLPLIAIIGRINRWKGHDRFVRIAAMVNAVVPARFAIVGSPIFRDEDFLPELHRLCDSLGIADRVTFIPWLDDPKLIYAAIDIHCNCSYAEPFGRTSTEAAAAGVPTICFRDGGSAETILDGLTGIAVAPNDERAFADAIIDYLRHPESLAAAGRTAHELRARFDIVPASRTLFYVLQRAAAHALG